MKKDFKGNGEKGGIYRITNIRNGKFYIGSTNNFIRRARDHESSLKNQKHANKHLQASWNKYEPDNFLFEVIEVVQGTITKIRKIEQKYIDNLIKEKKWSQTFNISKKTIQNERSCFSENPEETRRKLSEAVKKLHCDPVFKAKHKAAVEKRAKTFEFISPEGELIKITNLREFCLKHKLSSSSMHDVWRQRRGSYYGWTKYNSTVDWDERKRKRYEKKQKTVYQFSTDGTFIQKFDSVSEAARALGYKSTTNICQCANGKRKTSAGYIWRYDPPKSK